MKKLSILGLFFAFSIVFGATATSVFAQTSAANPASSRPVQAKGYREIVGEERKVYESMVRSGGLRALRTSQAQESADNAASTPPVPAVAIRITGDADKGVYADARSTGLIKAGTILIGVRVNPTGTEEFLFAYQIFEDVEPGYFWANLENGKKAAYSETGGIQRYEIWSLRGGQTVYSAEVDFQNPDEVNRATTTITDGFAYYEGNSLKINMFGSFSGNVGINMKEVNGWGDYNVPRSSIDLSEGFAVINVSTFPDYEPRRGDYVITIVDSATKTSNSFVLRINRPPANGKIDPNAKRAAELRKKLKY